MSDLRQWHAIVRHGDLIAIDPLDLEPAGRSCHYEPEIANLRLTGCWPVDLVEDAVTQRDPYPAGAERGRHHILRARRPGWPGARTSRCDRGSHISPAPCRFPPPTLAASCQMMATKSRLPVGTVWVNQIAAEHFQGASRPSTIAGCARMTSRSFR